MDTHKQGWVILIVAGLMEVVWAVAMGQSDGFTIWYYDIIVAVFLVLSMYLLSKAFSAGVPVGTGYAVWTGVGAVGTVAVSLFMGTETASAIRLMFVALIIIGIVGLQLTSQPKEE